LIRKRKGMPRKMRTGIRIMLAVRFTGFDRLL
jgi:hypothetical protein